MPWYVDIVNYLVQGVSFVNSSSQQKKKIVHDAKDYIWEEPYAFQQCVDQLIRQCVAKEKIEDILIGSHASLGRWNFRGKMTAQKILQSEFTTQR